MSVRKRRPALYRIIAVLLEEEDEKRKKFRERWCKDWYLQRSVLPSDCHLLNEKEGKLTIIKSLCNLRTDENALKFLLSKVASLIWKKDSLERSNITACETDCDSSVPGNWKKFSRFYIFNECIYSVSRRDNNRNMSCNTESCKSVLPQLLNKNGHVCRNTK